METNATGNRIIRQTCYMCNGTGASLDGDDSSSGGGCLALIGFYLVVAAFCVMGISGLLYLISR